MRVLRKSMLFLVVLAFVISTQVGAENSAKSTDGSAAKKESAKGIPIVVFNPLSWTRTDGVEVDSPFPGEGGYIQIVDKDGVVCAGQNIGDVLRFTARNVPPVGSKIFWARRTAKPTGSNVKVTATSIENQFYRVRVDQKRGIISSVYDKTTGKYIIASDSGAAILQIRNKSRANSSWREDLLDTGEVFLMDHGSAKARICMDHRYGDSCFVHELMLYDNIARIDMRLTASIQNASSEPLLRVVFPANIKGPKVVFGNQVGVADWHGSKTGLCGVRWLDLSASGQGISLLSDCKQGLDVYGNSMRMVLSKPDFEQKQDGMYVFNYSLYPHGKKWQASDTLKRSFEVTYPLVSAASTKNPVGFLGPCVSSSNSNVIIRAWEISDSGNQTLRLYETSGKNHDVSIKANFAVKYFQETDQSEKPIGEKISVNGDKFTIRIHSHEIKTLKLLAK